MNNNLGQAEAAPTKALENFWYHYKWHTIIIAFFAVFLLISIAQMSSKDTYDAHILYTGPTYLDGETIGDILETVKEASAAAGGTAENPADASGDGVLSCDFNKIVYVPTELAVEYQENGLYFNGLNNQQARGEFDNLIMIGEYVILLIEKSLYDSTVGADAFVPLEEALGYVPEGAYDRCGILLSALPIGAENGFRQLPDDTVLCCRAKSYVNNFNKGVQDEALYAAQRELFRQIVEYVPEED